MELTDWTTNNRGGNSRGYREMEGVLDDKEGTDGAGNKKERMSSNWNAGSIGHITRLYASKVQHILVFATCYDSGLHLLFIIG